MPRPERPTASAATSLVVGCLAAALALAACEPSAPPTPEVVVGPGPCELEVARANRGRPAEQGDPEICAARCQAGDARSCVAYGLMLYVTSDWAPARDLAAWHFENACTAGVAAGCALLGEMLAQGFASEGPAVRFLTLGCDGGDLEACHGLARLLARDSAAQCPTCRYLVTKDPARAAALFEQVCGAGVDRACYELALAYEHGRGVSQDLAHAAELHAGACEAEVPEACARVGVLYLEGRGVERDPARAAALLARGCALGDAACCARAGRSAPPPRRP
ncbi:MAG: sel1 repeat family protein [Myxococcales bacterium]|nr:sel1 repeat family protein [Myxococcales bacterium]